MPRHAISFALVSCLSFSAGCAWWTSLTQGSGNATSGASGRAPVSEADQKHLDEIKWAQQRAEKAPEDPFVIRDYARAVSAAHEAGVPMRATGEPWMVWSDEVAKGVDRCLPKADDDTAANLLHLKGRTLWVASRSAESVAALEQSLERKEDFEVGKDLVTAYALSGPPQNAKSPEVCARVIEAAPDDQARLDLMFACYAASPHEGDTAAKLPWASAEQVAAFEPELAARVAAERAAREEAAAREAARQEELARQQELAASQPPPSSSSGAGSGSSSGSAAPAHRPAVVSVSIKNNCRESVKLFYGQKPKFGSGTYSSLGSNTRTSKQMKPGDMVWLVDDSQNGIGGASVSETTREIEIMSSCTGIVAR